MKNLRYASNKRLREARTHYTPVIEYVKNDIDNTPKYGFILVLFVMKNAIFHIQERRQSRSDKSQRLSYDMICVLIAVKLSKMELMDCQSKTEQLVSLLNELTHSKLDET